VLWHLTLSTGRCVQSPRSAASDTLMQDFGRVLAEGGGEVGGLTIRVAPGTLLADTT